MSHDLIEPNLRALRESQVLMQKNPHRGIFSEQAPSHVASALLRQAAEQQAKKLDEGKEYWRFTITVSRNDVPAWCLYGCAERQQARLVQWLARRENVAAWPGQNEIRAIGQPAPLAVNITDLGSSILFELVGWRAKGIKLRCVREDGSVVFEQEGSSDSAPNRSDSCAAPVAVDR